MRLNVSGEWPGEVTIRTSWVKAKGRPWNEDYPYGYLRLIRGSSAFVRGAAEQLLAHGVDLVVSPPLTRGADAVWIKAGFEPFLTLHLYRRSLIGEQPDEDPLVRELPADFERLYPLDYSAFDPLWRMDPTGLRESYRATTRSVILGVDDDDRLAGFAIVGVSGVTGYLQRMAVDPSVRRRGFGRRLVRASLRWAALHGAAAILLNTQPENDGSAALYREEGFARMPGDLRVLKYER